MTKSSGRLILVRHGESEGNRDRTFTQHDAVALTDKGREQARLAGERIARLFSAARIVASPYERARHTAEIIGTIVDLPVEFEPDLREQSFGVFAGRPYESLLSDAAFHEGPRWSWRPREGESLIDVYERAVPAMQRIARASAGEDVVVVSHGGVMLALCAFAGGGWETQSVAPNAGIVVIEHEREVFGQPTRIDASDDARRAT
jgi:broad specificity phosphatase PhoE